MLRFSRPGGHCYELVNCTQSGLGSSGKPLFLEVIMFDVCRLRNTKLLNEKQMLDTVAYARLNIRAYSLGYAVRYVIVFMGT